MSLPPAPLVQGPHFIDGQWVSYNGGYALKIGNLFVGHIKQRGGDSIYAPCWIVSLNGQFIEQGPADQDYAKGLVERLIWQEVERLGPVLKQIRDRAPPAECFWGQDSYSKWRNWKREHLPATIKVDQ